MAQRNLDAGLNFGTIGQSFSSRAAEQFRDSRKCGDIDLYNEVDEFGKPTDIFSSKLFNILQARLVMLCYCKIRHFPSE